MNRRTNQTYRSKDILALLALLAIVLSFGAAEYFDWSNNYHIGESIVTLNVTASDVPKYIASSKRKKTRYSLKAQEFNGHFYISGGVLQKIRDNDDLKKVVENIKRGDNLQLSIYESDQEIIKGLYNDVQITGLAIGSNIIFTPEETHLSKSKHRSRTLWVVAIVALTLAFIGIARFSK